MEKMLDFDSIRRCRAFVKIAIHAAIYIKPKTQLAAPRAEQRMGPNDQKEAKQKQQASIESDKFGIKMSNQHTMRCVVCIMQGTQIPFSRMQKLARV